MSLTSEIRSKGWIYQLIEKHLDPAFVNSIIEGHNRSLQQCSVTPPPNGTNVMVSGMAMTYAIRDLIGLSDGLYETVAGRAARELRVDGLISNYLLKTTAPTKKAGMYVFLAGLDSYRRSGGKFPDWFPTSTLKQINGTSVQAGYTLVKDLRTTLSKTLDDVETLVYGIAADVRILMGSGIAKRDGYSLNPSFDGSYLVNGADAQLITGTVLWDIRTSSRRAPFTLENLYQQIGYLALDYNNEYQIDTLAWYYTRHRAVLTYPVSRFRGLSNIREEVRARCYDDAYDNYLGYGYSSYMDIF